MAKLYDLIDRYVWPLKRSWPGFNQAITDINGNPLTSVFAYDGDSGEIVTESTALTNATVYTCTMVRGNTIASLPCNVIQENNKQKQVLTDHPAYYLINQQPNSYMTAANFWKTLLLHVDVWGNAYAYINRDSRRNPTSLDIWEPWEVSTTVQDGQVFYSYNGSGLVPGRDVLHYRFYSWDGICGKSPVVQNKRTIAMALKLDRYATALMASRPPGILSYEGNLTPEQRSANREQFEKGGMSQTKVLSGRWKYDPVMTSADDSGFEIQREIVERLLCGIWQMPPAFVQNFERATFSNAEQMDLVYAKHTVTPICRNLELENNMKLFFEREKANTFTKFNMNGLLRGDLQARQSFYQSMVNTGVMSRNECRSLEDLNAYQGGDDFLVQGAMVPADLLRKKMENEMIPSAEGDGGNDEPPINGKKLNGHHAYN